jgi:colicin import membrane protein
MAKAAVLDLEPQTSASTDIAVIIAQDHAVALLDREKFNAFYAKLKADAPTDVDIATNKGRDTIRSYAAKVRSEKAAIDKDRLRLTKEWRDLTSQVNSAGKEIEEQLETLAVEIRAPLTAWEEAEKTRANECRLVIDNMRAAKVIAEEDTAASVRQRGTRVYQTELDPTRFGELLAEAESVKQDAIETLKRALARLTQEEADRAELAKLRAEREEADRVAAENAAAEEAERQRAEQERIAEERRAAAEKAEADRIAAAEKAAAERAQREAEEAAQAERDRVQREHDAALLAERARADDAERAAQAERDRIEADRVAAAAEAKRIADEQAAREANKAHRTRIKTAAKQAIMTCGADEETAQKIVLAIIAGEVPAVRLEY